MTWTQQGEEGPFILPSLVTPQLRTASPAEEDGSLSTPRRDSSTQ
jgi:hypothetical protein